MDSVEGPNSVFAGGNVNSKGIGPRAAEDRILFIAFKLTLLNAIMTSSQLLPLLPKTGQFSQKLKKEIEKLAGSSLVVLAGSSLVVAGNFGFSVRGTLEIHHCLWVFLTGLV